MCFYFIDLGEAKPNANLTAKPYPKLALRNNSQLHRLKFMSSKQRVVHSNPEILGGTPVFIGTRVPINTLLDYLEAGDSLDEFIDHFPSIGISQGNAYYICESCLTNVYENPLFYFLIDVKADYRITANSYIHDIK